LKTKTTVELGCAGQHFIDNITCTNGRGSLLANRYKLECFTIIWGL